MNVKSKSAGETVTQALGRPVRVHPLGPRPVPTRQRTNSVEKKVFKRTSSTGSIGSLGSRCTRPETGTGSANIRKQSGGRRSHDGGEKPAQDTRSVDNSAPLSNGTEKCSSSKQGNKTLTTSDILKLCAETEPCKVFEIDLHGKDLTCTPDLEIFNKLRILDLSGNYFKRISGLSSNKDLRELKMYDNYISAIEELEHLKELCCLQLQHNKITAIGRGLSSLKKLQSLRLDNNQISRLEIPELVSCSNITTLDLSHNRLESLAPLSYLPNLEELFATGNRIKKICELTKCKKLQEVDLSHNQISDLSGVANLPNLQILDVSHNQLKTLTTVGKLRSLEELNINVNQVEELSSLPSLFPNLQILFVCENKISRWNEICSLSGCLDMVELYITDNPFMEDHGEMPDYHHTISKALPKLEVVDGVTLKKPDVKQENTPLMRPMSATSIISLRHIDSQLKSASEEQGSMLKEITERFNALRTLVDSLPSESLRSRSTDSCATSANRCSSRSRLKEAQTFAAVNFNGGEDVNNL